MSKVLGYYHIVFTTKERKMTLPLEHIEDLYRFINKKVIDQRSRLLRIGGIQNHVHMLVDLHPSVSLSNFMEIIKSHSSGWLRSEARFPNFEGWSREYFAATLSNTHKDSVIAYINNQVQHHLHTNFDDEIMRLYDKSSLTYNDRDLR